MPSHTEPVYQETSILHLEKQCNNRKSKIENVMVGRNHEQEGIEGQNQAICH